MTITATRTVRELATEIPNATRTFERLGIDYCCGGSRTLNDACTNAHVSVAEVLHALEQGVAFMPGSDATTPDFVSAKLSDLIDHILTRHHSYVKQEVPRLQQLLTKVVAVHGKGHAELAEIQRAFLAMSEELSSHLMKEENVLFPYIIAMEAAVTAGRPKPRPAFGTVGNPVHMMELEHDAAGDALKTISQLSNSFTPPDQACFTYRTLFTALQEFEKDLHQHIHLENNILFPRAIAMDSNSAAITAATSAVCR